MNLWTLHSLGEAYGKRPSEFLGMETPWGSFQVDYAAMIVGRQVEKDLADGKPVGPQKAGEQNYLDPRLLHKFGTVKIKPDGTW